MRTTLFMQLLLAGAFALGARAADRAIVADIDLPAIGSDWTRRDDAGSQGDHSWVNFDSKIVTGEVLSFVAWKVPATLRLTNGPVDQASIEMFWSSGSARFSGSRSALPIRDIIRHRIVSVHIGAGDWKREVDMIEYTYVYEGSGTAGGTMAHGYCFVVGEVALFVQHTSPKVIDSELTFQMAGRLLSRHFQLSGKPHSIFKGRISQSNR